MVRWFNPQNPLHAALGFGIGCHHAGLPTKYRRAVEQLFRTKSLGIVVATTTLSQGLFCWFLGWRGVIVCVTGIHAPCRTVVIAEDNTFLNPTTFRQMIGRAGERVPNSTAAGSKCVVGRRGFDKLGYVLIWRVSASKLRMLQTAESAALLGSEGACSLCAHTVTGNSVLSASVIMMLAMRLTAWRCANERAVEHAVRTYQRVLAAGGQRKASANGALAAAQVGIVKRKVVFAILNCFANNKQGEDEARAARAVNSLIERSIWALREY